MDLLTPGRDTSEFSLAAWIGAAGIALQGFAGTLAAIEPQAGWVSIVVSISGALMAIASALGFQLPRAGLKREALRASSTGITVPPPPKDASFSP